MMFYRLALKKIIAFLKLDDVFEDDEILRKKPKPLHKTMLHVDQKMDTYVSILLSLISILICLTIPIAALEDPCESFKELDMHILYAVASWIKRHAALLDRIIIVLLLMLTCVSAKTLVDAILATNINLSPWRERGKYFLPRR